MSLLLRRNMSKVADAEALNRILIIHRQIHCQGQRFPCLSHFRPRPSFFIITASPLPQGSTPSRIQASGIRILLGSLDDHESLVEAIRQVDIVISAVAMPQHLDQINIINAIKQVGTIKRFVPSEFGMEVDRVATLPPLEPLLEVRRKVRRAIQDAGIPYTFVASNTCLAYFVDYILHPRQKNPPPEEVIIYGDGLQKVVWLFEGDIGALTVKAVNDPRTLDRLIIYRPPANVLSQSEMVCMWEKKTGRKLKKLSCRKMSSSNCLRHLCQGIDGFTLTRGRLGRI